MSPDEYISQRVEDQIKWYGKKSKINRIYYYLLKAFVVIFSVIITLMAGLKELNDFIDQNNVLITSILGALIAILTGLSSLWKFQDKWISYRVTAEKLKKEKFLFQTASEPYQEPKSFSKFVNNAESLMSSEKMEWQDLMQEDRET